MAIENFSKLDSFGSGTQTKTYAQTDKHGNTRTVHEFSFTDGYGNDNTTLITFGGLTQIDGEDCLLVNVVNLDGHRAGGRLGKVIKKSHRADIVVGDGIYVHPDDSDFAYMPTFKKWAEEVIAESKRLSAIAYKQWQKEDAAIDWNNY